MSSLQFTCEYTIQVVAFKCLFNFNFKQENVWLLGKVWLTILSPVFNLPHSSKALQTDVKLDIFVADFPLDPIFLWGLLVGIKAISFFF